LSAPSATLQSMKVSLSMTANETQREAQRAEARRWFAIADRDLATAAHCLSAVPPLIESAAYCCQQAAEKLMKGLLVAAARTFPKTHDLKELAGRASRLPIEAQQQYELSALLIFPAGRMHRS
jgi:HEPN domain-containing protein